MQKLVLFTELRLTSIERGPVEVDVRVVLGAPELPDVVVADRAGRVLQGRRVGCPAAR